MRFIEKKNAMKVFYYLIAVDGEIDSDKLEKYYEIGCDIDGEGFDVYKDTIPDECMSYINTASEEDDFYDVILEGIDEALNCETDDVSPGIPSRLLVWNMLAVAFSNDEYSETERRIISHVVRVTKMDKSVFLEMEQLIKTEASVERESKWIQASEKPYAEVRPIVEELEKRQRIIIESAKALIEDEIESDSPYVEEEKRGILDDTMTKIGEKVNPIASEIGNKTVIVANEAKRKIGETVSPAVSDIKAGAGKLLGKIKAQAKKRSGPGDDVSEDNEETGAEGKE